MTHDHERLGGVKWVRLNKRLVVESAPKGTPPRLQIHPDYQVYPDYVPLTLAIQRLCQNKVRNYRREDVGATPPRS